MKSISRLAIRQVVRMAFVVAMLEAPTTFGQLYAIERGSGDLHSVNTTDAELTLIGNTGVASLGSLEYRSSNGMLYGLDSLQLNLYRIDPVDAKATLVGATNVDVFEGALVIAPDGTAYGANSGGADSPLLFKIDLDTAFAEVIGAISGGRHDINGLAWRSDGMLVGLDRITNSLLAINPVTAASSVIAPVAPTVGAVGGMAAAGDTGYFSTSGPTSTAPGSNELYSFNLFSGAHALVGSFSPTISGIGVGGLALRVPEPATILLWLIALGVMIGTRRAWTTS